MLDWLENFQFKFYERQKVKQGCINCMDFDRVWQDCSIDAVISVRTLSLECLKAVQKAHEVLVNLTLPYLFFHCWCVSSLYKLKYVSVLYECNMVYIIRRLWHFPLSGKNECKGWKLEHLTCIYYISILDTVHYRELWNFSLFCTFFLKFVDVFITPPFNLHAIYTVSTLPMPIFLLHQGKLLLTCAELSHW